MRIIFVDRDCDHAKLLIAETNEMQEALRRKGTRDSDFYRSEVTLIKANYDVSDGRKSRSKRVRELTRWLTRWLTRSKNLASRSRYL